MYKHWLIMVIGTEITIVLSKNKKDRCFKTHKPFIK